MMRDKLLNLRQKNTHAHGGESAVIFGCAPVLYGAVVEALF
jgi:hypothetical protein